MNFSFNEVSPVASCPLSLGTKNVGLLSFDFSITFDVVVSVEMCESKLV